MHYSSDNNLNTILHNTKNSIRTKMRSNMHMEMINLVKSLRGTYKKEDREMVVEVVNAYKEKYNCSYRYAYDMTVEGNPSFSTYNTWRRKAAVQDKTAR